MYHKHKERKTNHEQNFLFFFKQEQQTKRERRRKRNAITIHLHYASKVCELMLQLMVVDYGDHYELLSNICHRNISNKLKNGRNIFLIDDTVDYWHRCMFEHQLNRDPIESKDEQVHFFRRQNQRNAPLSKNVHNQ